MSDRTASGASTTARQLLLVLAAAMLLRLAWVGVRYARNDAWAALPYPDEEAYVLGARSLAAGAGLIDEFGYRATYMPAYPAFLSLFVIREQGLLWARVVQALLAAAVAPATYLLAHEFVRWRAGANTSQADDKWMSFVPLIAGALAAADPFLVFFSGLLLTEALYAAALVGGWACVMCAARPKPNPASHVNDRPEPGSTLAQPSSTSWGLEAAFAGGLLLLLAIMLRPGGAILALAGAAGIVLMRRFSLRGQACAVFLVAVLALGLLPWAYRNARVIGEWRWLTTRGGISLYDGVGPKAGGDSDLAYTKLLPEVRNLSETQWDAWFRERSWSAIREDPARVARLGWAKLRRTWSLSPNVAEYRQGTSAKVSLAWMLAVLSSAVVGAWISRRAWGAILLLLTPVILTSLMHMFLVGSVRYRVPVMPMVMVLSATGLAGVMGRWARARVEPDPREPRT